MWGTATTASASAIRPTGMLIQKTQRQPQASVMRPPDERADEDRDGERGADDRHDPRAFARRRHLADDRLRHEVQAGRADALRDARDRELRDVLRETAEQRRDEEQGEARQEDQSRTDEVGELAEHRQQHRARERVRDDDPAHLLDGAEFAGDRRERRGDDGVIERAEERHGEQGDDEEAEPPGRERHMRVTRTIGPSTRRCVPPPPHHGEERTRGAPTSCPFYAHFGRKAT